MRTPAKRLAIFNRALCQPAHDLDTRTLEHVFGMRRIGEFAGQVLAWEVQVFVQVEPPLGAVGHIVDKAFKGDKFSRAAFAGVTTQFLQRDGYIGDGHTAIIA